MPGLGEKNQGPTAGPLGQAWKEGPVHGRVKAEGDLGPKFREKGQIRQGSS